VIEEGFISVEDIILHKDHPGDWSVESIYGPGEWVEERVDEKYWRQGPWVEKAPIQDKDLYTFELYPDEVDFEELCRFKNLMARALWDLMEEGDEDSAFEFEEEVMEGGFWAHGDQVILDEADRETDILTIGDEVLWRQSLPQKQLVQSLDQAYLGPKYVPNSGSYWQAYGPVMKGVVQGFRDPEDQDMMHIRNLPWSTITNGGYLVQVGEDISKENLNLADRDPMNRPDLGSFFIEDEITDENEYIKTVQKIRDTGMDWYAPGSGMIHSMFRFIWTDLIPAGYIRKYPEVTSGKFVWKLSDSSDEPRLGGPATSVKPRPGEPPTPTPGTDITEVVPPEIVPEIEEIVPPEVIEEEIVPPPEVEIIPPEVEIIPPEVVGEIVPPEEVEEIVPPPVKPKKKKKKKRIELEVYA
jgi:hypothetical protein